MWVLTVGGTDVTDLVQPGATFTETASSSGGLGSFSLSGSQQVSVGSSVLLSDPNGVVAWEGSVAGVFPQYDLGGTQTYTTISALPLAAQCAIGIPGGGSGNVDAAVLAASISAAVGLPWGGPPNLGETIGSLSFSTADEALSILALLAGMTWRVQNGRIVVVGAMSGYTALSLALACAAPSVASITVKGGPDAITRQPIQETVQVSPTGSVAWYASYPEISDSPTLDEVAEALSQRYEANQVATAAISAPTIRAGDWVLDTAGIETVCWSTRYQLTTTGGWQNFATFGFPALSTTPVYSPAMADALHRNAPVRIQGDYVLNGLAVSISGLVASISGGAVCIGNAKYTVAGTTLVISGANSAQYLQAQLANGSVSIISSTAPAVPGQTLTIAEVSVFSGTVIQNQDLRTFGGVGTIQLMAATPGIPTVAISSISFISEGGTQARATIVFTVGGITLDQTIQSIDLTWSLAGQNAWHPAVQAQWAPTSQAVTAYLHGLAAGTAYDVGVIIRGRDGTPLTANPLLLGSSPTISSTAVANALNMDNINDGLVYARPRGAALTSGFIDLSLAGVIGRSLKNIADDAGSNRFAVLSVDGNRRPLVDLSSFGHLNKNLDFVDDGLGSNRFAVFSVDGNRRALVDFAQAGHVGQFQTSAWFLAQQSILPIASDFKITATGTYPSSGAKYISYSWGGWTWKTPDGTTATYASGFTSSTTTGYLGGAIISSQYFVTCAYNWGSLGNVTTWFSNGPISLSVATQFMGNGKMTLVVNQGPITVPSVSGTSGSSYTPQTSQCPAATQPIETLERGVVPAGTVRVGEHVSGFGGCWVRVTNTSIRRRRILRVVIQHRAYDVEEDHLFLTKLGWWPVRSLRSGDTIVNLDSREPELIVEEIHDRGVGDYAAIEVVGHILRLSIDDPAVSHNVFYQTD